MVEDTYERENKIRTHIVYTWLIINSLICYVPKLLACYPDLEYHEHKIE